jgi:hypothetical protein
LSERENTYAPAFPTAEEVEDWNPRRRRACTAQNFRPDISSPPGTPWNKSVTEVFVESFLQADVYDCRDPAKIRLAFSRHLRHLRRTDILQKASQQEKERQATRARRDERKRKVHGLAALINIARHSSSSQLFERRLRAAERHPSTRRHVDMIKYLGVDGVSTDESDHENNRGVPQYLIVQKPWRNPTLSSWYRALDSLHRHLRFRPVRKATRGAQPHIRLPSSRIDGTRGEVAQLPINAYNERWLDTLTEEQRRGLYISMEPYDFSHPQEIIQYACLLRIFSSTC